MSSNSHFMMRIIALDLFPSFSNQSLGNICTPETSDTKTPSVLRLNWVEYLRKLSLVRRKNLNMISKNTVTPRRTTSQIQRFVMKSGTLFRARLEIWTFSETHLEIKKNLQQDSIRQIFELIDRQRQDTQVFIECEMLGTEVIMEAIIKVNTNFTWNARLIDCFDGFDGLIKMSNLCLIRNIMLRFTSKRKNIWTYKSYLKANKM